MKEDKDDKKKGAKKISLTTKEEVFKKWKPILEKAGITDPEKQRIWARYCETHEGVDSKMKAEGKTPLSDVEDILTHDPQNKEKKEKVSAWRQFVNWVKWLFTW